MNLTDYQKNREKQLSELPHFRTLCPSCLQPDFSCYCPHIQKFNPQIEFAILIHPIEVRRRIATGRMSHLCLENSHLISGQDYTHHEQVNSLIQNPKNQCFILYPGQKSVNLSDLESEIRNELFLADKKQVVFVIDGTWATARKMIRLSRNLHTLQRICFSPTTPSTFRVRKQPASHCYSTIEAIHHVIELLGPTCGFQTESRKHDRLLKVFDRMVERQLEFIRMNPNPKRTRHRRAKIV